MSARDSLPPAERRREVLLKALELFAERGYAGGSLRELARRLGVQQPSLYHYFSSKEDLLQQVVDYFGQELLYSRPPSRLPQTLDEVPELTRELLFGVYEQPLYLTFLRFLFAISPMQPGSREAAERLYSDTLRLGARVFLGAMIDRGELDEDEAADLVRMLTHATALTLIERRVLYGMAPGDPETERFGDFVTDFFRVALRAWRPNALRSSASAVEQPEKSPEAPPTKTRSAKKKAVKK